MTNAEYDLQIAKKALIENKLTDSQKAFIEDIKNYDKDALNGLSGKQYQFLHGISKKFDTTKGSMQDIKIYFDKIGELTTDIMNNSYADAQAKIVATEIQKLVVNELARHLHNS